VATLMDWLCCIVSLKHTSLCSVCFVMAKPSGVGCRRNQTLKHTHYV
jgi:hypothetical protein